MTAGEGRKFAFTVGLAFAALTGLFAWRGHAVPAMVTAALSAGLLLAGIAIPGRLDPVYRGWMAFALLLSRITTPVFMGIVYFMVISPIGLLMRLFGRNPLAPRETAGTRWISRAATGGRGGMENQF